MPSPKNNFLPKRSDSGLATLVSFIKGGTSRPQSFPRKRESIRLNDLGMRCKGLDSRFRGNDQCFERNPIPNDTTTGLAHPQPEYGGFSLLEMMVSVLIILLLMSAIFPFIMQSQKRFQGNEVVSESNQSARAALEVMSQEIGQAGFNPNFYPNKTSSVVLKPSPTPQCVTLSPDIKGISPGDYVSVDTGTQNEIVQVTSTSNFAGGGDVLATFGECAGANQIQGIFTACHNDNVLPECPVTSPTGAFPISSYKMPFGGGLLIHLVGGVNDYTQSTDSQLEMYGDINQTQTINYVVYSISPMVPNQTVCIPYVVPGVACPAANLYTLYNLYRSITPVNFYGFAFPPALPFTGAQVNNPASPMVEKVLFHCTGAAPNPCVSGYGPTAKPIFGYPAADQIAVGVVPNQVTAIGTIVITLCVAVSPKSLETTVVTWYTMATQIRPLNLTASVNVNNTGGGRYLSLIPASLPMTNPAGYYP